MVLQVKCDLSTFHIEHKLADVFSNTSNMYRAIFTQVSVCDTCPTWTSESFSSDLNPHNLPHLMQTQVPMSSQIIA